MRKNTRLKLRRALLAYYQTPAGRRKRETDAERMRNRTITDEVRKNYSAASRKRGNTIPRFWSLVSKSRRGCWLWKGRIDRLGYGCMSLALIADINNGKRERLAHRIAWILQNGPIPRDLDVLHKCDVRCCCNPRHLFLGTQQDNMEDCKSKGRFANNAGTRNPSAKLYERDVHFIRSLRRQGVSRALLAKRFNVQACTISAICLKRLWSHIK